MKQSEQLEQQLRQTLRESENNLSDNLQSRLSNIRQAALSDPEPAKSQTMLTWPGFAVGMATVVVVAMLFAPMFNSTNSSTFTNTAAMAMVEQEIENDLEFYQWLLETDAIEGLHE
ncbi:hypothetical protein QSV34_11440 [Porticoccus sp. W117]|uniref:hypothetical protein n=1 Tax=Porticoccus sp. W117 TaxID=3054777 RepID=UPI0025987904|nr:hypothetical protein [Porticoccus sp. W117]MDM3871960.1 hypothetical protein [Porticoccus sp. W117]